VEDVESLDPDGAMIANKISAKSRHLIVISVESHSILTGIFATIVIMSDPVIKFSDLGPSLRFSKECPTS